MPETARKRALVVDDDDPIRNMLTKIIQRLDLDVDSARDGGEAIEWIQRRAYTVILLDLMMPKVDGYAVLRYINESQPDLLRCTIIASAVPESEILKRFEVPVFRMHAKPFDITRLMRDIRECAGTA